MEISTAPAAKLVYQLSMYSFSSIFHSPIAMVYWSELARQITFAKMKSSHGAMKEVKTVYTMIGLLSGRVILAENLPSSTAVQQCCLIDRCGNRVKKPLRNLEGQTGTS